MKKLYQVTCCGKSVFTHNSFGDIFVIAENYQEAKEKALNKMKELKYDKVDDYVSKIILVADEEETNKCLLII